MFRDLEFWTFIKTTCFFLISSRKLIWTNEENENLRLWTKVCQNFKFIFLFFTRVLDSAEPWWWNSNFFVFSTSVSDNPQVNSSGYWVVALVVDFWKSKLLAVLSVDRGLGQVSQCSCINHVSDDVFSDSFVFWDSGGAGFASHEFNMSSALLVPSVISSLLSHLGWKKLLKVEKWC